MNISDEMERIVKEKYLKVIEMQEEILTAFIAKYGMPPDEIEIIEQYTATGHRWFIKKSDREINYDNEFRRAHALMCILSKKQRLAIINSFDSEGDFIDLSLDVINKNIDCEHEWITKEICVCKYCRHSI
jgi:hypothetical protein